MAWNDGNVNGVANASIGSVSSVARSNNIKFVNNVDGGNALIMHEGSMLGTPELVYTSVSPSSSIANGDIVYEDASLNNTWDGGDDTYFWNDPTCTSPAFVASADIDPDGEVSNRACVVSTSWTVSDITGPAQSRVLASSDFDDIMLSSQVYVTNDGLQLIIITRTGSSTFFERYSIATANDITSTLTFVDKSSAFPRSPFGSSFTFSSDGLKVFALDNDSINGGGSISEYSISSGAFNLTNLSTTSNSSITLPSDARKLKFSFNRSGTTLYTMYRDSIFSSGNNMFNQTYTLSTAWDLSTASANTAANITSVVDGSNAPTGCFYMYDSTNTADHWVNIANGNPRLIDFKDGITASDVNSTKNPSTPFPTFANISCINNDFIYLVRQSGTSPSITFTLTKYLTNV